MLVTALQWAQPLHSVTSPEGKGQPWGVLAHPIGAMDITTMLLGGATIASAVIGL